MHTLIGSYLMLCNERIFRWVESHIFHCFSSLGTIKWITVLISREGQSLTILFISKQTGIYTPSVSFNTVQQSNGRNYICRLVVICKNCTESYSLQRACQMPALTVSGQGTMQRQSFRILIHFSNRFAHWLEKTIVKLAKHQKMSSSMCSHYTKSLMWMSLEALRARRRRRGMAASRSLPPFDEK